VASLPWLGRTWQARGAAYWWRRAGASLTLLFALAVDVGFIAAILMGIRQNSVAGFRILSVVLTVVGVGTAIPTWMRTSPSRIEAEPRNASGRTGGRTAAGGGVGLGTLARAGSPLATLLLFALVVFTAGPILVLFLRSFGREMAVERRERAKLGLPHP
jgi:hypothetical protein